MAEEVVLMKGNEAIARYPYRSRRLLWLSHHSPIGNIGNAGRRETLGNYRYGGVAGRK
jgi:hypothetical protein